MNRLFGIALIFLAEIGFAGLVGALGGCEVNGALQLIVNPDAGGGGGPPVPNTDKDAATDAGEETGPGVADTGPSPVLLGITPNPRTGEGAAEPTAGDELAAALTTLAAGARSVVISRPWRDLDIQTGYTELAADIAFFAQHKRKIAFNLAFVDRNEDGRPPGLKGIAWDAPASMSALEATIDQLLKQFGNTLDVLTFGRDVDVYLGAHPDELEAVAAFVEHACVYAHAHPAAAPELRVGVATSYAGAADKSPGFKQLLAPSDVMVLSYMPGLGGDNAAPTSEVANQLDTMIDAAGGRPILLQAVGYPTDPDVGGSPEKQSLFYDAFFDALLPRRASFLWVNVHELHDLSPTACGAYADAQGDDPDGPTASFACSLGLFTASGEEKPAWLSVLQGTATFASP